MAIPMPSLANRYPLEAAFARQLDGRLSLIMWVIRDSKFFTNLPGKSNELAAFVMALLHSQVSRPLADPGNIVAEALDRRVKAARKLTESGERAADRDKLLAA
jgi:hypothetical protein